MSINNRRESPGLSFFLNWHQQQAKPLTMACFSVISPPTIISHILNHSFVGFHCAYTSYAFPRAFHLHSLAHAMASSFDPLREL